MRYLLCVVALVGLTMSGPRTATADAGHRPDAATPVATTEHGPHGGQVARTDARAYEFIRHERSAMLLVYTRDLTPVAVRTREGIETKRGVADRPRTDAVAASGTLTVATPDGAVATATLRPRTDAMTGVSYLQADLPAGLGSDVSVQCAVRVGDAPVDAITFVHPATMPIHGPAE